MSSFVYGELTSKRELSEPGTSSSAQPPGVRSFVDALVALVPAEVLAVHALIIGSTTSTTQDASGESVTTITDPTTLQWSFWGLILLSIVVYLGGRWRGGAKPVGWDAARALIPPVAFVLWTMLQRSTAFDAVGPDVGEGARYAIGVLGAVVIGVVASLLAVKADQTSTTTTTDAPTGADG